ADRQHKKPDDKSKSTCAKQFAHIARQTLSASREVRSEHPFQLSRLALTRPRSNDANKEPDWAISRLTCCIDDELFDVRREVTKWQRERIERIKQGRCMLDLHFDDAADAAPFLRIQMRTSRRRRSF